MKRFTNLKKFSSLIVLLIILGIFIAGFQILSSLYSYRSKDSFLTTLDKGLFEINTSDTESSPFAIDKITWFTVPFAVKEYDLLDINRIAFIRADTAEKSATAGIYDMSKSLLTDDFQQNSQTNFSEISASPDGKMILTSFFDKAGGSGKAYIYDISTKKNTYIISNIFSAKWLPGSNEFVATDDYLFAQNANTGKRKNLLKLSEYIGKGQESLLYLMVSKDGKTVYLTFSEPKGITKIISVNMENGNQNENTVMGSFLDPDVIDNEIITIGMINGIYALFCYDLLDNSYSQLASVAEIRNQKYGEISISPDGGKIAYSVISNSGIEIHAASLINDKITDDEVVYRGSEFIKEPMWTKDSRMLYFLQRNTTDNNTDIYRILFENSK